MTTAFLDLIVVLFWPLAVSGAAWIIAVKALAEPDEITDAVEALTRPNGAPDAAVRPARSHRTSMVRAIVRAAGRRLRSYVARARGPAADHAAERAVPAFLQAMIPVFLAAGFTAAASTPAHAARFEFDSRRTEVRFVYKMAYATQRGRFTKVSGTLDYDEAVPEKAKISASISAASLTTGEALVDNELKGKSFFNVVASPIIAFKSLTVRPKSATTAEVAGEITVNGITKPITLKVSLKPHDDPALKHDKGARQFIATARIQRSAFNMTDYQSMVDDEIDIEIVAIARPR